MVADLKWVFPLPPFPPRAATNCSPATHQVLDHELLFGIQHDGAWRHVDGEVLAATPMAVRATPVPPAFGPPHPSVCQCRQTVDAFRRQNDHAAAVAAIATVGTAFGNVALAAETAATVATVASRYLDLDAIDKHGSPPEEKRDTSRRNVPECYKLPYARKAGQLPTIRSVADDIDASPPTVEHHHAVGEGKQRVVLALSHIRSGVEFSSQLANQDMAGPHAAVRQTV